MKFRSIVLLWFLVLNLVILCSYSAYGAGDWHIQKSCKEVVQEFYAWYVPRALNEDEVSASDIAIKQKSILFSTDLLKALTEDADERSKAKGEIVGLDFDPFLNTQDPSKNYMVGDITQKGNRCWVNIYGVWSGKRRASPDVVPELALINNKWQFVNFHYGKSKRSRDENLVEILRRFHYARRKL